MRALFVDDEVEFLELMEKRLTRRGMEVVTAPDGQSALDLLDQALQSGEMFQIVVMDVRMPGMDGLETLRHMKEKAPPLPVIVLTGLACMGVALDAPVFQEHGGSYIFLLRAFFAAHADGEDGTHIQTSLPSCPQVRIFSAQRSPSAAADRMPPA